MVRSYGSSTVIISSQILSLEDYLSYEEDTDLRYELVDGELQVMPPESDLNQRIASFLFAYFLQLGIPFYRLRIGVEVVVSGTRATVRLPDLVIFSEELANEMASTTRATIMLDMPPPQLVVEVVSPGKANAERDYRYKRSQYQARGIPEYWIVDPTLQQVTVLSLVKGLYEERGFEGEADIVSDLIQTMGAGKMLNATQVLTA